MLLNHSHLSRLNDGFGGIGGLVPLIKVTIGNFENNVVI